MNCVASDKTYDAIFDTKRLALEKKPLAFTSDANLVHASSRIVLKFPQASSRQHLALNVEVFEPKDSATSSSDCPLLLYVPGICESVETTAVQAMAKYAKNANVRMAVLELEGHGLSDGKPALCRDFEVLVLQVLQFVNVVTKKLMGNHPTTEYVLCGSSLGGTLVLYAAEYLSLRIKSNDGSSTTSGVDHAIDTFWDNTNTEMQYGSFLESLQFSSGNLEGVVSITPAIGVNTKALPPSWIVSALGMASYWFPSAKPPLTPLEDPSHYNCPKETTRNFSGHWPLATSKMLLDVTSTKVAKDMERGLLRLNHVKRCILIAGEKDHIIPLEAIQLFEQHVQCSSKELHVVKRAGHDVLSNNSFNVEVLPKLFLFT